MNKLIIPTPEQIFLINLKDKWTDRTLIATQKSIDHYRTYWKNTTLTIIEDLGTPLIDCEIKLTSVVISNCYVRHDYQVQAKVELTDRDFQVLKAWNCFLNGQRHGDVVSHNKLDDGTNLYHVMSERDSGD